MLHDSVVVLVAGLGKVGMRELALTSPVFWQQRISIVLLCEQVIQCLLTIPAHQGKILHGAISRLGVE